jgi:hypothetical protein
MANPSALRRAGRLPRKIVIEHRLVPLPPGPGEPVQLPHNVVRLDDWRKVS